MRCENDLIAFVRKFLEGDTYKFNGLRVQEKFRRVYQHERAAHVMVVVVLLDVGEVTDKRHLDGSLRTCAHAGNVAFESVVFIDDFDGCALEERFKRGDGNVEFYADAREQWAECRIDFPVERFDFFGLPVAS